MYFKFEQVGLTQDKAERQPADEAVYVMEHPVTGERVLVPGSSLGDKLDFIHCEAARPNPL